MSAEHDPDLEPPTQAELEQAQALAESLQRGRFQAGVPEDALAGAQLLRISAQKQPWQLSAEVEQRVLQEVLTQARPPRAAAVERRGWWFWLLAGVPLAALTLWLGVGLLSSGVSEPSATNQQNVQKPAAQKPALAQAQPRAKPEPSLSLLQAQAQWISTPQAKAQFDAQMRQYREQVYVALGAP